MIEQSSTCNMRLLMILLLNSPGIFGVSTLTNINIPYPVDKPLIHIIRSEELRINGPIFRYLYETNHGVLVEKEGREGSNGQSNFVGYYRYPLPDGTIAEFRYTADEGGYNVDSNMLPEPHPMPEHAIQQVEHARHLRALGVEWDNQGFVI